MSQRTWYDTYRPVSSPRNLPLIIAALGMVGLMIILIVTGITGVKLGDYFIDKLPGGALLSSLLAWGATMKATLMFKDAKDMKEWLLGGALLWAIGVVMWYLSGAPIFIHKYFAFWACAMVVVSVISAFRVHLLED